MADARNRHTLSYRPFEWVKERIEDLWSQSDVRAVFYSKREMPPNLDAQADFARRMPVKRPPPWYVGMTSGFKKDVEKIDMKIRGRILEAIARITENPVLPHGDTVKPLAGDYAGCWRYRVGDYRLIYYPDKATGDVALLAFASRGSAYD